MSTPGNRSMLPGIVVTAGAPIEPHGARPRAELR